MLKGENHHCAVRTSGKGKKQVTHGEKPGMEQIGEYGKKWVKTAKGFAITGTCSYSEIKAEIDTLWVSSTLCCSSWFYWQPIQTRVSILFWFTPVYVLENAYTEGHIMEVQSFQAPKTKKCQIERLVSYTIILPLFVWSQDLVAWACSY